MIFDKSAKTILTDWEKMTFSPKYASGKAGYLFPDKQSIKINSKQLKN